MRFNERLLVEGGISKADMATLRSILRSANELGTIATQDADDVNIDGGVIDGTIIGVTVAVAGTFTTLTVTTATGTTATFTTLNGTLDTAAQPNITSLGTITALVAISAIISGGTLDDVVIGGSTPNAATVTALINTGLHRRSVTAGITAFATGGQTDAVELTTDINEVSTVTSAGDSIKLPSAVAGLTITIINNAGNDTDVFPDTGDNLGAGVDTAVSLVAGSNITYVAYNGTNWESV